MYSYGWYSLGYYDGYTGVPLEEYRVQLLPLAYLQGYQAGQDDLYNSN